jgi:hypothetical protein
LSPPHPRPIRRIPSERGQRKSARVGIALAVPLDFASGAPYRCRIDACLLPVRETRLEPAGVERRTYDTTSAGAAASPAEKRPGLKPAEKLADRQDVDSILRPQNARPEVDEPATPQTFQARHCSQAA